MSTFVRLTPSARAVLSASVTLAVAGVALAQSQVSNEVARTQEQQSRPGATERRFLDLDDRDQIVAEIWGLTQEEMKRAKLLLQGPRAAFSVQNLSPVEALGIHARSEAERRKYAELFARAVHQDVERSLAFGIAYQEAMQRMYPNEPVVDYGGAPKVSATVGAADMLNVPRTQLIQSAPPAAPSSPVPAVDRR